MKTFKILGISTDQDTCDCCGKADLQVTVKMLNNFDSTVAYYGTTCAGKASNWTSQDDMEEVKRELGKVKRNLKWMKEQSWQSAQFELKKSHGRIYTKEGKIKPELWAEYEKLISEAFGRIANKAA